MRVTAIMQPCGILIAVALLTLVSGEIRAAPASEPIAWRENHFSIPFRVNRSPAATDAPTEVRLFVSVDEGKNWSHTATVDPKAQNFVYRAATDGLYAFAIRSVDRSGRLVPDEPLAAELFVSVDTQPPQLDLTAVAGTAGEIVLRWQASDRELSPDSLRIDVRCADDRHWQPLAIGASPPSADRRTRSGEARWVPPANCRLVLVRAEVQDRAGNPAVRQVQVEPLGVATANQAAQLPDPNPQGHTALSLSQPPASTPPEPAPPTAPAPPPPTQSLIQNTAAATWPTDRAVDRPLENWLDSPNSGPPRLSRNSEPPAGTNVSNPAGTPAVTSGAAASDAPAALWFSTAQLQVDYVLPDALPSSPVDVELWGTDDRGTTWRLLCVDDDRTSPLFVSLDRDAKLGIRIALADDTTGPAPRPKAGDLPEAWIGIDRSPPRARLLGTRNGSGSHIGLVLVDWEVSDDNLPDHPVRLQFSPHRGGPWSTITEALPSRGRFSWRPPPDVPAELFIRIEARDAAGNQASDVTADPVWIDRDPPTGMLRGIKSTPGDTMSPPRGT